MIHILSRNLLQLLACLVHAYERRKSKMLIEVLNLIFMFAMTYHIMDMIARIPPLFYTFVALHIENHGDGYIHGVGNTQTVKTEIKKQHNVTTTQHTTLRVLYSPYCIWRINQPPSPFLFLAFPQFILQCHLRVNAP